MWALRQALGFTACEVSNEDVIRAAARRLAKTVEPCPEPSVMHERDGETFVFEPLPSLCECGSNTWVFTHISTGLDAKACARCAKCSKAIELAQQTGGAA